MHVEPLKDVLGPLLHTLSTTLTKFCIEVLTSACKDQPSPNTQFLTLLDHQNFSGETSDQYM